MNKMGLSRGRLVAVALSLVLVLPLLLVGGCGPSDPTESELDRVPNVPPSTRGAEGKSRVPGTPTK